MQIKINELQEEEEKLRKIINIVRPTTLPELTKPQIEENTPKVEPVLKVNPKSDNGPSSMPTCTIPTSIPTSIPKEVKKIDTKIKPNAEEKVEVINKEKINLNEAEGIITDYIELYIYYIITSGIMIQ